MSLASLPVRNFDGFFSDCASLYDIITRLASHFHEPLCSLNLYDAQKNVLAYAVGTGMPSDYVRATKEIELLGIPELHRALHEPAIITDMREDPAWFPLLDASEQCGLRSVWAVPLAYHDLPLGLLCVYRRHAHVPGEEMVKSVAACAKAAAHHMVDRGMAKIDSAAIDWEEFVEHGLIHHRVRPEVASAWLASSRAGLCAKEKPKLTYVSPESLTQSLETNEYWLKTASTFIEDIIEQYRLRCAAMMCDRDGTLLLVTGNADIRESLNRRGIRAGVMMSSHYLGNTSIYTALRLDRHMYLSGPEHYFKIFHEYSTVGHPIHLGTKGRVVGAVSFLFPRAAFVSPARALVKTVSNAVELSIERLSQQEKRLSLHREALTQLGYEFILLDRNGHVLQTHCQEEHVDAFMREMREALASHAMLRNQEIVVGHRQFLFDTWFSPDGSEMFGIFNDITFRKQLEQELLESERVTSLGRLTASIAHEIRNPLTAAMGIIQLLQSESSDGRMRSLLKVCGLELRRIGDLVTEFMRLETPMSEATSWVNVSSLIEDACTIMRAELNDASIDFSWDAGPTDLLVYVDESGMKQVLSHLVQNAYEACEDGGTVTVTAELLEGNACIRVTDTGSGMSPAIRLQMFRPFFTTKDTGTGLGLSVSRSMIKAYGGDIFCESSEGIGTTFTIALPVQLVRTVL